MVSKYLTIVLFVFSMFGRFEPNSPSVNPMNYPGRTLVLKSVIQEIKRVTPRLSEFRESPIPERALSEENFEIWFIGFEGIWARWSVNLRYIDEDTGLYYYGYVRAGFPPEGADADPDYTVNIYKEPVTERDRDFLKLLENEREFSDKRYDAWNYIERAEFYEKHGIIRDPLPLTDVDDSVIQYPTYPGISDLSYYEALIKVIRYGCIRFMVDTLVNGTFKCKEHGYLCRDLDNIVIGSGFYQTISGRRYWIIRFFKVVNIGGEEELLKLHEYYVEDGKIVFTL